MDVFCQTESNKYKTIINMYAWRDNNFLEYVGSFKGDCIIKPQCGPTKLPESFKEI